MLLQELGEAGVVRAAIFLEQGRADLRDFDLQPGVLIRQPFAASAEVGAEPGVDLDGRAIDGKEVTSVGTGPAAGSGRQSWIRFSEGARSWARSNRWSASIASAASRPAGDS